MSKPTKPINTFTVDDQPAGDGNREAYLRKQIEVLRQQNTRLQEEIGSQKEFAEAVAASVVAAEPLPLNRVVEVHPIKPGSVVVPVLKLSDWHIGEVIQPDETEGFGRFNYAIAQARIFGIVEDWLRFVDVQRLAYKMPAAAIFCLGDYISGDIHHELQVTNEFPLPEQTGKAGLLLGEVLRQITGRFKQLDVYLVGADNHGRLTHKPQAKQKTSNNMSFLVHALTQSHLARCPRARLHHATGMKHVADVGGWKFLLEHGDTIRGQLGFPYYGFGRAVGREASRRMNTVRQFHYHAIAHFHVPAIIPSQGPIPTLVNGSLSGTSEYDHACGRHAHPAQVAFMMHPRHGLFGWTPFRGREA